MPIIETLISAAVGAIFTGSLFKTRPYCLWIKQTASSWILTNPAGNSARRCKKARAALEAQGWTRDKILILPKGTTPPPPAKEG